MPLYEGKVVWTKGATLRPVPNTTKSFFPNRTRNFLDTVNGSELVADSSDPANINKLWMKLLDSSYIAVRYPDGSGTPQPRVEYNEVGFPPPDPTITSYTATLEDDKTHEVWQGTLTKKT